MFVLIMNIRHTNASTNQRTTSWALIYNHQTTSIDFTLSFSFSCCSHLFWGNDLIKPIHPRLGPCLLLMCIPHSSIIASIMPYVQLIWFNLSIINNFMCYSSQGHLNNKQRAIPMVPNFLTQKGPLLFFTYGPCVL